MVLSLLQSIQAFIFLMHASLGHSFPKNLLTSSLSIASATAINKKMKAWTKNLQLDHNQIINTAGRLDKSIELM